jgi:hypothetical protein
MVASPRTNCKSIATVATIAFFCAACSATLPAQYEPQSIVRVKGTSYVGSFEYQPYLDGDVERNQISSTVVNAIYMGSHVDEFVRRATALEMEMSGIDLNTNADRVVTGRITELTIDALGFSIDWSYEIEYSIVDREDGTVLFRRSYVADPRTTGKFGLPSDYTSALNDLVRDPIEQFLRDQEASWLFSETTRPEPAVGVDAGPL